jgi:hypothetical protein
MINSLDNGDVIKSNKRITKQQNLMFLDLLGDFSKLVEENISPDERKSIREEINTKINNYLSLVREDKLNELGI